MMPSWTTGRWLACASPTLVCPNTLCCGYISSASRPSPTENSCIFHGMKGCTLDRLLRADICNSYYCGGLGDYMRTGATVPTKVFAGEADETRTSPVLIP